MSDRRPLTPIVKPDSEPEQGNEIIKGKVRSVGSYSDQNQEQHNAVRYWTGSAGQCWSALCIWVCAAYLFCRCSSLFFKYKPVSTEERTSHIVDLSYACLCLY